MREQREQENNYSGEPYAVNPSEILIIPSNVSNGLLAKKKLKCF